ncbi:MAG: hypothetical protein JXB14_02180 [Candidatus Altiarchaeota archaeon]|nr:hypothetical protein [Candidatus Altiarchaeota archaeon]
MTYHSYYEWKCPCGEYYIPYKKEVRCYRCGAEGKFYDIVSDVLEAVVMHKEKYGAIMPPAYFVGTLSDHYIFISLEYLDAREHGAEFKCEYKNEEEKEFWEGYFDYLWGRYKER